jgi:hypothetical protein
VIEEERKDDISIDVRRKERRGQQNELARHREEIKGGEGDADEKSW